MAKETEAKIIELEPMEETITVDGLTVTIDRRKYGSFKFMLLTKQIVEAQKRGDQDTVVFKSIEIIEFILGEEQLDDVLAHFGGDVAEYNKVVDWYQKLARAVRELKN